VVVPPVAVVVVPPVAVLVVPPVVVVDPPVGVDVVPPVGAEEVWSALQPSARKRVAPKNVGKKPRPTDTPKAR
jgi:hypothetical protein